MKTHVFLTVGLMILLGVGLVLLTLDTGQAQADTTRYVRQGGTGDGTSWATASGTPQDMIDEVVGAGGGEVWVAAGTYTPTVMHGGTTTRHLSFQMKNGVGIYGGFPATGSPTWADRDWEAFRTTFSGDIGNPGTITGNCYHVFYNNNVDITAILDGFTITAGNANGIGEQRYGGGMYNQNSHPDISNCVFYDNVADWGGGIYNAYSDPLIVNSAFLTNTAVFYGGGGVYNYFSNPILINCTLFNNSADDYGGGMYNQSSSPRLTNSIFWHNPAPLGTREIHTAIGTPIATNCNIQGGYPGTGNISLDPMFVRPENGDFHLLPNSPCIDSGSNGAAAGITHDFEGNLRILDGNGDAVPQVDMGIDEVEVIHVKPPASGPYGADDGSSWADAFDNLQAALAAANSPCQIWVASGSYTPAPPGEPGTRTDSFQMKNNVGIYGGFPNVGSPSAMHRNWLDNPTILTGEVGSPSYAFDNCYHVFYNPGSLNLDSTARLDGFTITAGRADGPGRYNAGGGMYNSGSGGMCHPTIVNCAFNSNYGDQGAGVYNINNALPDMTNCTFWDNMGFLGCGMANLDGSDVRVTNCTFNGNGIELFSGGAGMYNEASDPVITNCILWGNAPDQISNSVMYGGSPTVTYSDVQGGYPGTGNIDQDPMLLKPETGYLHLKRHSPCIDSGSNGAALATGIRTDFDGDARIIDGDVNGSTIVDMGADEHRIVFVRKDNAGNGSSWSAALAEFQMGLWESHCGDEIWVSTGTYTPAPPGEPGTRTDSFRMKYGLDISGGFPATGTPMWADRDWENLITILSGNIGNPGTRTDNCYHVFYHPKGLNLDEVAILNGFVVRDGNADGPAWPNYDGGGMYNWNSSPTILNCTFTQNNASNDGGGIFAWKAHSLLDNSLFTENSAGYGGGMHNDGDSSPIMTDCNFYENIANQDGGGMFCWGGTPMLTNCEFAENTAVDEGGGMYLCCDLRGVFTDCAVFLNTAYRGGGIHNTQYSHPTLIDCIIGSNTADGDKARGGGMYNGIDSSPAFIDCTFLENLASGTEVQGGGMYNWTGSPTYTGCEFIDNQASGTQSRGGGMFNRKSAPILIESTFSHNMTEYQGGGVYNIKGTPTFSSCTIADNHATGTRSSGGGMFNSEYPCFDPGSGPAIGSRWTYTVNYNCNEIGVSGSWFTLANDTVWDYTVTGTDMFNGNLTYVSDAEINGDALRRYPYPGGVTPPIDMPVNLSGPTEKRAMIHHDLIKETVPFYANVMGGINMELARAYDYTGRPSNLSLNSAWTYQTEVDLPTFAFHEEMNWNAQVTAIENITVPLGSFECYKVEANGTGGALPDATNYFWWSVDENLPVPVKYTEDYLFLGTETFELSMYAPYGEIYNCDFSGNTATLAGGGMVNEEGSCPTITQCNFTENEVTGAKSFGGGMYNQMASPTVYKSAFSGNWSVDGGGMYNLQSQPNIGKSRFESNRVTRNGGGMANSNSDAILSDCSFWYNSGTNGGGIYNLMSDPAIDKSHFNGNTVNQYGGGLYNEESSPDVTNSRFSANAAEFGGGMYNLLGSPSITNCTFFENQALGIGMNGDGGGVDNYRSSSTITNCTFYGNYASSNGGGIFNYDCTPTITNCILWGDTCGDIGDEIRNASANPVLTYSNIQGGYPGSGNISGTPIFANPGSGDFRLMPTSPCIDSGSNPAIQSTGVVQDFEGDARIMGGIVDMGVDETVPTWNPWIYDTNYNGKIDYPEMVEALMDYLIDNITYTQMVEVLMLYLTT